MLARPLRRAVTLHDMNDPVDRTPADYVPDVVPAIQRDRSLSWADAALIVGSVGGMAMTLYTIVSRTQPWHFIVIAAALLVCVAGVYHLRGKF